MFTLVNFSQINLELLSPDLHSELVYDMRWASSRVVITSRVSIPFPHLRSLVWGLVGAEMSGRGASHNTSTKHTKEVPTPIIFCRRHHKEGFPELLEDDF